MDSQLEKIQQWHDFTDSEDHELAWLYVMDCVKRAFHGSRPGVPLSEVPKFLLDYNISDDVVQALGFQTVPHFLFHLEKILELRAKKINGRIIYFLFGKKVRSEEKIMMQSEGEVYHDSTFPVDFYMILNLYRNALVPLNASVDYTFKSSGRSKPKKRAKDQEKLDSKAKVEEPQTQAGGDGCKAGEADSDDRKSCSRTSNNIAQDIQPTQPIISTPSPTIDIASTDKGKTLIETKKTTIFDKIRDSKQRFNLNNFSGTKYLL